MLFRSLNGQDCPGAPLPQDDRPQTNLPSFAERYSFTGQANERLLVNLLKKTTDHPLVQLKLFGPNRLPLIQSRTGRLPAADERFVLPVNGTYEIELSANEPVEFDLTLLLGTAGCKFEFNQSVWSR